MPVQAPGRDAEAGGAQRAGGRQAEGWGPVDQLRWLKGLAYDPRVPATAVRVAIAIGEHVNRQCGYAWPSINRMAKLVHISEATVKRATGALVSTGWLTRTTRKGRKVTCAHVPTVPPASRDARQNSSKSRRVGLTGARKTAHGCTTNLPIEPRLSETQPIVSAPSAGNVCSGAPPASDRHSPPSEAPLETMTTEMSS